jgi:hypothetical protein
MGANNKSLNRIQCWQFAVMEEIDDWKKKYQVRSACVKRKDRIESQRKEKQRLAAR